MGTYTLYLTDHTGQVVGSSKAISALRERITRIAATDFTVIVEGAIGPHPHLLAL